jgi:hypothetical protein
LIAKCGRIAGASPGNAVGLEFPGLDLKTQYGGLKHFIESHCPSGIEVVARQGLDDVYALRETHLPHP